MSFWLSGQARLILLFAVCVLLWMVESVVPIYVYGPHRFRRAFHEHHGASAKLPLIGMTRHMVVADSDAEARALAEPAYLMWVGAMRYLWDKHGVPMTIHLPPTFAMAEELGICVTGTPSTVRDKLLAQCKAADVSYFLCRLAFGNVPIAATLKSVELIKREIMPAFA